MGRYPKGIEARQNIIQQAVRIYNEEGLGITLEQLARKLNISRGSITNYFPTKDNLFIAIAEEYEITLNDLLQNYDWGEGPITLRKLAGYFGAILDNQYSTARPSPFP
jgi:AcrR family transcriptional regulator